MVHTYSVLIYCQYTLFTYIFQVVYVNVNYVLYHNFHSQRKYRNTYSRNDKIIFTPFHNEMGCIILRSHYPFKCYFVKFLPTFLRPWKYVHLCLNQKIISTFCLEGQKDKVFYIFARQGPFTKQFTNSRQSRKEHYLVF